MVLIKYCFSTIMTLGIPSLKGQTCQNSSTGRGGLFEQNANCLSDVFCFENDIKRIRKLPELFNQPDYLLSVFLCFFHTGTFGINTQNGLGV